MPTPTHSILTANGTAILRKVIALTGEPFAPSGFQAVPYSPEHDTLPQAQEAEPAPGPHRVLKDTIILRVEEAGKLTELMDLHASLPPLQRWQFDQAAWFSSDNPLVVQGITALGLNPAAILAPDPLAP